MNAIQLLINEHDEVRKTIAEINEGSHQNANKKAMFGSLCQDLIRHETMEQTIWYPILKGDKKLNEIILHLLDEEKSAEKAMKEFTEVKTEEEWEKKFAKFQKDIEHHACEEETNLFPKVEEILSKEDLEKIGKEMLAFKKEYIASI